MCEPEPTPLAGSEANGWHWATSLGQAHRESDTADLGLGQKKFF